MKIMLNRAAILEKLFIDSIRLGKLADVVISQKRVMSFSNDQLIALFDSQMQSRLLDILARDLKEKGQSFYTIGSSGHEGNAVFGQVFPYTDIAFLHYRSGAFFIERSKQLPSFEGADKILLSLMACREEPISGGRHKVFGSLELTIPPQTSTIASHLPKALGAALSIRRAKELGIPSKLKMDGIVLCSFGDASFNHASAQTTFNACSWLAANQCPLPIIFICEDNGLGISVKTPIDWVKNSMQDKQGIHYIEVNGLDVVECYQGALQAQKIAREKRQAVFLHMRCIRLMGHAGSDIESQYLSKEAILAQEDKDPLLVTASYLLKKGLFTPKDLINYYFDAKASLENRASALLSKERLNSKEQVMASLISTSPFLKSPSIPLCKERKNIYAAKYAQLTAPRTLQQNINFALLDLMIQYPTILVFGEDVGKKGGVYRVTADLQQIFSQRRVFDTLLDETTILGSAIGFAHNGFMPIPEIQFLAYFHNAEDQLRGEAATLSFFSNGQYQNPMIIRIAAFAYQKGFGGHFHNDNSIAVLRDIPGLIIATPSNGEDAVKMLRECVRLAYEEKRIIVFLEPIALYMTKDLHAAKDNLWLSPYPDFTDTINLGEIGTFGTGNLLVISYANGYYLSRQAAEILLVEHGISIKVIDIRWLAPLPMKALMSEAQKAKSVLIVDEGRKTGSISETIMATFLDEMDNLPKLARITGEDTFIPLGDAWEYVLPSKEAIINKLLEMR